MLEKLPQWDMGAFPGGLGPQEMSSSVGILTCAVCMQTSVKSEGCLGKYSHPYQEGKFLSSLSSVLSERDQAVFAREEASITGSTPDQTALSGFVLVASDTKKEKKKYFKLKRPIISMSTKGL